MQPTPTGGSDRRAIDGRSGGADLCQWESGFSVCVCVCVFVCVFVGVCVCVCVCVCV